MVGDKDASTFPYLMAFLLAFGAVKAIKILIDLKQLRMYKQQDRDPRIRELFTEQEFLDSQVYNHEKK